MKKTKFTALLVMTIALLPQLIGAATFGSNSANITSTYLLNGKGYSSLSISYGPGATQYEYIHFVGTDIVDNVKCVRIIFLRTATSEFDETWAAQDVNGDIYILKYWDGEDAAPVELGAAGAVLVMPKNPEVDDVIFDGEEQVTHVDVTVPQLTTGLGPFTGCIQTIDLEDGDINYYAPDVGMVKKVDDSGSSGWELKYLFEPKPNAVVIPLL